MKFSYSNTISTLVVIFTIVLSGVLFLLFRTEVSPIAKSDIASAINKNVSLIQGLDKTRIKSFTYTKISTGNITYTINGEKQEESLEEDFIKKVNVVDQTISVNGSESEQLAGTAVSDLLNADDFWREITSNGDFNFTVENNFYAVTIHKEALLRFMKAQFTDTDPAIKVEDAGEPELILLLAKDTLLLQEIRFDYGDYTVTVSNESQEGTMVAEYKAATVIETFSDYELAQNYSLQ